MNTTVENNKIIAEFLGNKPSYNGLFTIKGKTTRPSELQYNSNWNWLMEVVSKIEKIPNVYEFEEFLLIRDELCTGRIETSFDAVINFLNWYNEQKN